MLSNPCFKFDKLAVLGAIQRLDQIAFDTMLRLVKEPNIVIKPEYLNAIEQSFFYMKVKNAAPRL